MPDETIDSAHFRHVLGHFPTGVTAVTSMHDGEPVGMTIGSFTSVSLDPPLVAFLPGRTSGTWSRIRRSGGFCVNILTADHLEVCGALASTSQDKFDCIGWKSSTNGSPMIEGVLAWIDCEIVAVHEAGDHDIVVGRVLALEADAGSPQSPLLFYRGGYGDFASRGVDRD